MFDRSELILKITCLGLGALLVYQVASLTLRSNPLRRVSIPEVPALPVAAKSLEGGKGTNSTPGQPMMPAATNSVAVQGTTNSATNAGSARAMEGKDTNSLADKDAPKAETNAVSKQDAAKPVTNSVLQASNKTDLKPTTGQTVDKQGTNASVKSAGPSHGSRPGSPPVPGGQDSELPPLLQARIDRIYQSEILGQVMRPMPMGLLGIAGNNAFLRAPNGQTGMVKEGDELGGIKLLRIGTNRVLVEQNGEKKELIIFEGFGGESLLPKQKETTNEKLTQTK